MAQLARGCLKRKQEEMRRALTGRLTPAQCFVLRKLLNRYEELEVAINRAKEQISREVATSAGPFVPEAIEL